MVFVDESVDDYQQLIDDIESQLEKGRRFSVVSLDSDRDGIAQISDYLNQQQDVAAVHIFSHGANGEVFLGNGRLNSTSLDGYAEAIEGWQQALSNDADLLFYGCNIAASNHGQDMINALTLLTGADVAASRDATGSVQFGGNWDLEYSNGEIQTDEALAPSTQQNWNNVLSTFIVNTTADTIDVSLGDGNALDGAGNTSLRAAIMQANASGGSHTIILGAETYRLSLGPAGDDAAANGDLDITCDLTITGAGAGLTIINGGGLDRVFDVRSSGNLTISNVTIQGGDSAGNGGGVQVNAGSQLTLNNVIISGNQAGQGAGLYNAGTVLLTDVEFSNNGFAATATGGGLHNAGDATLNRVTISGSQADTGAGIYNDNSATNLSLTNVTLSGNTAASTGGGLYTRASANIVNSTLTLNSADTGGGIRTQGGGGTVDLQNTIVAGNSASSANSDVSGTFSSSGYNLIGDGTGSSDLVDGLSNDQVGTTASPVDPMLDSLKDNGGFNQTHALLVGSPAIDAGISAGAPLVDQRGLLRDDGSQDIGSYEVGANITPATADLYLTTEGSVTSGGQDGLSTWNDEDLITIGDPNLSFGPGTTGTFAMGIDLTALTSGANVDAAHLVSRDLQIGASNFQLRAGDLLLSDRASTATYTSNNLVPLETGFSTAVSPDQNDVIIFRPDTPADYTRGQFGLLIDNMVGTSDDLMGFTLIEQNITVGGYALKAGDFLYTTDQTGGQDNKIWLYGTGTVGSGSTPVDRHIFLDGDDAAVGIPREIQGLELLEQTTRIGDRVFAAGTILTHVDNPDQVGSNDLDVDEHDIFALDVKTSSLVGAGNASASLFFDGTSVNFGSNAEDLGAIALGMASVPVDNAPPLPCLLVSTAGNVTSSGAPGMGSWDEDEVLRFGSPGFSLGAGTNTTGEFSFKFDLGAFGENKNINGLHYVRSTLTIGSGGGSTEFTLQSGDLLLTVNGASPYTYTGNTTAITIYEQDVFVFRPQATGDYSGGEFYYLLDNPIGDNVRGLGRKPTGRRRRSPRRSP